MDTRPSDLKHPSHFNAVFSRLEPVMVAPFPRSDFTLLRTVRLTLFGQPTPVDVGALASVHKLGVDLCCSKDDGTIVSVDLTSHLCRIISDHLATSASFRDEYKSAMSEWIQYLALAFPTPAMEERLAEEKRRAQELVQTPPLVSFTLGDRNIGWLGGLHPFNFLFHRIDLPPLDLQTALESARIIPAGQPLSSWEPLRTGRSVFLRFRSSAPADPGPPEHHGRINALFEFVYENIVYHAIQVLSTEVSALRRMVDDQRKIFLIPIRDGIAECKEDIDSKATSLNEVLTRISQIVAK